MDEPSEPSKSENGHSAAKLAADDEGPHPSRASLETLKSLDISDHIPKIISSMDTEDSPWGGL